MKSPEKTVAGYIKSLPPERALVIGYMRQLVNENISSGFMENMRWGLISWEIPLDTYPDTYNGQPLNYVGLAAQKHGYSLYLMSCYVSGSGHRDFKNAYLKTGKKLDIGKSCIRFKSIDDLPLSLIAKYIRKYSVPEFIRVYEASRRVKK